MKKLFSSKIIIVLIGLAGLMALILLSTALGDLSFTPPQPFSFSIPAYPMASGQTPSVQIPGWKYASFFFLLLLAISIIALLIDPALRKRFLHLLLRITIMIIVMMIISNVMQKSGNVLQYSGEAGPAGAPAAAEADNTTLPEYTAPQISPWLVFTVTFGIILCAILLGRMMYERNKNLRGTTVTHQVANIAREALDELQSGNRWDEAIVKAYIRMNEVAYAERGMLRQPGITPGEFSLRMQKMGLPTQAVQTLTNLFEDVRYGGKTPGEKERAQASAALQAILQSCGRQT